MSPLPVGMVPTTRLIIMIIADDLDADNRRWERLEYFLSTAFVGALADALGVLSLLPPPAQREQAQGETPYHPPSRGQPEAYAAVIALYVQVSRF